MGQAVSLVTFFAAAKKVTAAPHRGSANKPTRIRDPANNKKCPNARTHAHRSAKDPPRGRSDGTRTHRRDSQSDHNAPAATEAACRRVPRSHLQHHAAP